MKKRIRPISAKRGQLKVGWGREPGDTPEVQYGYNGPGRMKADNNLVMHTFNYVKVHEGRSLIEELEARGYDLTTLKFSIELKPENLPPKVD